MASELPLGDLLEVVIDHRGKTPKKMGGTDFTDAGVPVVSAIHVKNGRLEFGQRERYVPYEMFERWMPERMRKGDVLLTSEAPLGEVAQVPSDDDLVLSQRLFALRGRAGVLDSSYLRYFLETPEGRSRVLARASGTTVIGIRQAELVKILIPVPPIDEQRRIAGVLGALDDLIETNRQIARQLADQELALFRREWDGCTRVRLADVATVTMGQSPPGDTYNETGDGTPFYQGVRDFGWRYPSRRVWTTAPTRVAQAGDVLVAVRAPIGELNLAGEPTALGRGLGALRAEDHQATLFQALQADSGLWDMHQGTGTVFAAINKAEMAGLQIPWVKSTRLESALEVLDAAIHDLSVETSDLTTTRDELLPLLMSGRVRARGVA